MAASIELLQSELVKLRKIDLIRIILHGEVPIQIANKDVISLIKDRWVPLVNGEDELFHDTSEVMIPLAEAGEDPPMEVKYLRLQVETLNNLNHHLGLRIDDLNKIILLMTRNHDATTPSVSQSAIVKQSTADERAQSSPPSVNQATSVNKTTAEVVSAQTSKQTAKPKGIKSRSQANNVGSVRSVSDLSKKDVQQKAVTTEPQAAVHRVKNGKRNRSIIGTNNDSDIKTVPRQGYLHVSRMTPDTNEASLVSHLKRTAPNINFICRSLKKTETACSYIVNFPLSDIDSVYNPEIWPAGAEIRRYYFRENSQTFQKQQGLDLAG